MIRTCHTTLLGALLPPGAQERQATPAPSTSPVDPAGCTVESRPIPELRALAKEGFAARAARAAATPVNADASAPAATPPIAKPADPATGEAAVSVVREYFACSNAGNLPALFALTTDDLARRFLSAIVLALTQASGGTPFPENPDLVILDEYLAAAAFPVPVALNRQTALIELRPVTNFGDGAVGVVFVTATSFRRAR